MKRPATSGNAEQGRGKPTDLFLGYVVQLIFRLVLFAFALYLFVVEPAALDAASLFGVSGGFNFVDFVFVAILLDFVTKFLVRARISAGSLKQYRVYHIPTLTTLRGSKDALRSYRHQIVETGKAMVASGKSALADTYAGLVDRKASIAMLARHFLHDVDFLHVFSFKEADLTVDQRIRAVLYRDRAREVVPVTIFWVVENALVAMILAHMGWLNSQTALLWCLFYFVFDMVCVVLWCPLQLVLMRNRCCTTCQIFNWDAIMVATPLLFVGGWFGWLLIALALVVLARWELAAFRYPERFDERTNARLSCAQCADKLCYLRGPFRPHGENRMDLLELMVPAKEE